MQCQHVHEVWTRQVAAGWAQMYMWRHRTQSWKPSPGSALLLLLLLFISFVLCFAVLCYQCRPQGHCYRTARLIRASRPPTTPRAHSASRPCPQRSTGGNVRSLACCHAKETWHCCRVNLVVFSSTCSDSTNAGHHLLCLLLKPLLAKLGSQTVWASFPESRPPLRPSVYVDSDVEGFDQNCLRQGRKQNTETEVTTRAWREGLQKPRQVYHLYTVVDEDEDDNWWCYRGPFRFETTYRAGTQTMLTVINIPV